MNAAFATTLISREDFVAGLVVLQALTLESPINAIDTECDSHGNKDSPIGNRLTVAFAASILWA